MDINIKLSNLTPEEAAIMLPALRQVQELHDKRMAEREERYVKQIEAAKAYEITLAKSEPEPTAVEQPEEAPPLQEVPKEPDPQIDLEAVRGVLNKLKQEKGTDAVRKVLEKFNVKRVPDIPTEQYVAVLDAVALCYATEEA